jgi:hypothetical protein
MAQKTHQPSNTPLPGVESWTTRQVIFYIHALEFTHKIFIALRDENIITGTTGSMGDVLSAPTEPGLRFGLPLLHYRTQGTREVKGCDISNMARLKNKRRMGDSRLLLSRQDLFRSPAQEAPPFRARS